MTDQSKLSLRSLTIHRYEQFVNCPRIELSPDDNLILGINGSGKTSLLRLLAAVLRWNYDALLDQPFDIEFEQVVDEGLDTEASISGRVTYEPMPFGAEQRAPGRRVKRSKYEQVKAELVIHHRKWKCMVGVSDSMLHIAIGDNDFGHTPLQTSWMSLAVASVLNDDLASHLDDAPLAFIAEQIHARAVATFMVRETEIDFAWLTKHFRYDLAMRRLPDRFEFLMLEQELLEPEARQWSPLISGLAWVAGLHEYVNALTIVNRNCTNITPELDLRTLLEILDAKSISFQSKIEKTESIAEGKRFEGKGVEIHVRFPSDIEVIDSRLTVGQKRLTTIALGALLCGGSPLLIDEIDNGLHLGLLEKVLGLIRGRQTFIATHNKLVVDLLDYESPEDIRRTIHICRRNQDGTQSLIALSEDQVREMFEKIEAGIMNLSDVLLQEGLW